MNAIGTHPRHGSEAHAHCHGPDTKSGSFSVARLRCTAALAAKATYFFVSISRSSHTHPAPCSHVAVPPRRRTVHHTTEHRPAAVPWISTDAHPVLLFPARDLPLLVPLGALPLLVVCRASSLFPPHRGRLPLVQIPGRRVGGYAAAASYAPTLVPRHAAAAPMARVGPQWPLWPSRGRIRSLFRRVFVLVAKTAVTDLGRHTSDRKAIKGLELPALAGGTCPQGRLGHTRQWGVGRPLAHSPPHSRRPNTRPCSAYVPRGLWGGRGARHKPSGPLGAQYVPQSKNLFRCGRPLS